MIGVCVTFIRVAYGRRIYMSVPKIVKVQFLTQGFIVVRVYMVHVENLKDLISDFY